MSWSDVTRPKGMKKLKSSIDVSKQHLKYLNIFKHWLTKCQSRKETSKSPDSIPSPPRWEMAVGLWGRGRQSPLTQQNGAYPLFCSLPAALCTDLCSILCSFLGISSHCLLACFSLWRKPCRLQGLWALLYGGFPPCQLVTIVLGVGWANGERKVHQWDPLTLRKTPLVPPCLPEVWLPLPLHLTMYTQ